MSSDDKTVCAGCGEKLSDMDTWYVSVKDKDVACTDPKVDATQTYLCCSKECAKKLADQYRYDGDRYVVEVR